MAREREAESETAEGRFRHVRKTKNNPSTITFVVMPSYHLLLLNRLLHNNSVKFTHLNANLINFLS